MQPPPDNSFERRADRRNEHTARKSTVKGFDEAPQRGYVARAPLDINAELANALGYGEGDPNKSLIDDSAGEPPERDEISIISEPRREKRVMHRPTPQPMTLGVTASMEALDKLLREGRPEFASSGGTAVWTPHRPPRPDKSEGGVRIELKSELTPKGDQPTAIKDLVEGARRHDRTQVLLGVTGSGKTFTMGKVIEATQRPAIILAPNKTLAPPRGPASRRPKRRHHAAVISPLAWKMEAMPMVRNRAARPARNFRPPRETIPRDGPCMGTTQPRAARNG